ncbi:MAG: FAD-dependent oxidoreductase [Alphaproteobacteria bacterium]|nr:FAD-dependent oxidoreductase [Alphaproteobacteria bacterium]
MAPPRFDVAVIGAGFGGLAAALTLAEGGARVLLCEALSYPGGCASTFSRRGYRFEAGATLFSGLAPDGLFGRWIQRYAPALEVRFPDPVIALRAPGFTLDLPPRPEDLVAQLCAMPGAPVAGIRSFFAEQQQVAATLWGLFDDPGLLPPFREGALLDHLRRLPRYLPLLRLVGRPLVHALRRHGVADWTPLRATLDASCQISVQCGVDEAEAPFAMAALDYPFRQAGHVRGGIGRLAWALARAVERLGGDVRMAARVRHLARDGEGWALDVRGETVRAERVVANLLPQDLQRLAAVPPGAWPRLDRLAAQVAEGWGAAMLYLGVDSSTFDRREAHHIEIIDDTSAPLIEGNHLFCSISGADEPDRAPPGQRTVTVSTHLSLQGCPPDQRAARVQAVQDRMRDVLQRRAPKLWAGVRVEMPASPRTFQRFTRRHAGLVGGIPRRAGLHHYAGLLPRPVAPGLHLVGDSVFPGQSTLAVAIGGVKVARAVLGDAALQQSLISLPAPRPASDPAPSTGR